MTQSEHEIIQKYKRLRMWGIQGTKPRFKLPKYTDSQMAYKRKHSSYQFDSQGNYTQEFLSNLDRDYDAGRFYHLRNKI